MSSRLPWKPTLLWTLVGFTLVIFAFFQRLQVTWKPPLSIIQHKYFTYNLLKEEPPDASQFCQIPRIHPFDPSILSYLSSPKPIRCKVRQQPLTFIGPDGFLRFNETSLASSGYHNENIPFCTYQEILRPEADDFKIKYGDKKPLPRNGTKVTEDFIFVSCYNFAGIAFYTNIHLHVVPIGEETVQAKKQYNVLILGIDSLSRLSFIRHLPKTYSYLTQKMNAFIFRGMTKVGDNTFPNLGAMLTGKSVTDDELHVNTTYDDWPSIWKDFSQQGYVTMFAEDRPDIGLFNYLRAGFKNPPTNHYLRPFWLAAETSSLHMLSSHLCFGAVPKHQLQLNYTKDFVVKYSKEKPRPFFGFSFFVELSHDYMSQVSEADDDFLIFLEELHISDKFKDTFFFFMSDHGHRFDAMRTTLVGRIEERMPFFAIVMPPSFVQKQPKLVDVVKSNLGRLTSPYDIYFTLRDILFLNDGQLKSTKLLLPKGASLFTPISENRTCLIAHIPEHYCTCEEERTLDINDDRAAAAAIVLLDNINYILEAANANSSVCSKLSLEKIHRVDLIIPNDKVISNSRVYFGNLVKDQKASGMISKLRVVIKTIPGNAIFESTLVHREDFNQMMVLGDISRINKYGEQSWCVNDAILKKFCFCEHKPLGTIKNKTADKIS